MGQMTKRFGIIELAWIVSLVFDTRVDTISYRGTRIDTRIFTRFILLQKVN